MDERATLDELREWLVEMGLEGTSEIEIVKGSVERLNACGFEIMRAAIGSDILHPLIHGRGFFWHREHDAWQEDFNRNDEDEEAKRDWQRSPFFFMLQSDIKKLRRRLDDGYQRGEFPLLDTLQDEGATDYLAAGVSFGKTASLGTLDGILCSMATSREGGFTERQIDLMRELVPLFGLAYKAIATVGTGRTLMATYLGEDAGQRVLGGDIQRGEAEAVDAILWYSDLKGFTKIADREPAGELMRLLNDYADVVVSILARHGGQVLKFMGDGILAMFPTLDDCDICNDALDAAIEVARAVDELNERRRKGGRPTTDVDIALHRGEVLYGNIGSRERLDFTVIGPAVNEVSRIETMCDALDQPVIISQAFADWAGSGSNRLVSLGRYMLRGVKRPQELYTIDPECALTQDEKAEQLVLEPMLLSA